MDLEEYRRIYMRAEGIGNTPVRLGKSFLNFGSSFGQIPKALKRDKESKERRKENRAELFKEAKENGKWTPGMVKELAANRPRLGNETSKAVGNIANSGLRAAMSANELGQTAAAITGTRRSNMYDGQDLENGIRFALKATAIVNKGIQLPRDMMHKAEDLFIGKPGEPEYFGMDAKNKYHNPVKDVEKIKMPIKAPDLER